MELIKLRKGVNKSIRNAFVSWTVLLGAFLALSVVGMVIGPRIQAMYEIQKVGALVEKENLIKQIFEVYYDNSNGDLSQVPQNIDDLITRAKADKLLTSSFAKDNGFGGEISFTFEGGLFKIGSNLPSDNELVKNTYRSKIDTSVASNSEKDGKSLHEFSLAGSIKNNTARLASFVAKAQEAGAVTSDVAASNLTNEQKATTKWWDYNLKTNTYEIKSWDSATSSWVTSETKSYTGEVSNKFYTATNTTDISASTVESGSKLYVNENGSIKEYLAYDGKWQALSSGATTVATIDNTTEYNRLLAEAKAANTNVLTKAEADILSDKTNTEWWEYDTATSRFYIYRWSATKAKWIVAEVREINQYKETITIAFFDTLTNRYTADVLSALPATKVDNGDSLDLVTANGIKAPYSAVNGLWVAVNDNSNLVEDENGILVLKTEKVEIKNILSENTITDSRWPLSNLTDGTYNTLTGYQGVNGFIVNFKNKTVGTTKMKIYDNYGDTRYYATTYSVFYTTSDINTLTDNSSAVWTLVETKNGFNGYINGTISDNRYEVMIPSGAKAVKYKTNGVSYYWTLVGEIAFEEQGDAFILNQEVDQPNWKKYQIIMSGISYKFKSNEGSQTVLTGDYVLNVDDGYVYKRLSSGFVGDLKSIATGGGINYGTITSWEKIALGNNRCYVSKNGIDGYVLEEIESINIDTNTTAFKASLADTKSIGINTELPLRNLGVKLWVQN